MFKKLSLATLAVFAVCGIAVAGGFWNGLPYIGGDGTICLSYGSTPSTLPGNCNQFWPAGPQSLAPTSTFPSDTNVQSAGVSLNPATVAVPAALTGATVLDNSPLTGASITVPAGTSKLVLTPAGTIATLTVVLPAAASANNANGLPLFDGQTFSIYTNNTVTALTVTAGTGTTITPTITTVTAAAPVKLVYVKTSSTAGVWQLF